MGMPVEIVKLHGNIELAPITGMAERIIDITATGITLRENNLVVDDVLLPPLAFANLKKLVPYQSACWPACRTCYSQTKEN